MEPKHIKARNGLCAVLAAGLAMLIVMTPVPAHASNYAGIEYIFTSFLPLIILLPLALLTIIMGLAFSGNTEGARGATGIFKTLVYSCHAIAAFAGITTCLASQRNGFSPEILAFLLVLCLVSAAVYLANSSVGKPGGQNILKGRLGAAVYVVALLSGWLGYLFSEYEHFPN